MPFHGKVGTDAAVIREINVRSEKIQTTIPSMVYYSLCFSSAVQVIDVMLTSFSSVCEIAGKWLKNFALLLR